jgi:hypothetical protein
VNVGPSELLVLLLVIGAISFMFLALPIWAIVDAARRPDWQYDVTGQSKTLWIVLPAVGLFVCVPGAIVAAIVYFASVRPKLTHARQYDDRWSYGHGDHYGVGYGTSPPSRPPSRWRRPGPPPG